jgi:peptide/nickel transport system permease protein
MKILKNKTALTGFGIILFFSIMAVIAPLLTPENPVNSIGLASPLSVPEWATVFPQYRSLPPNTQYIHGGGFTSETELNSWRFSPANNTLTDSNMSIHYSWVNPSASPSNLNEPSLKIVVPSPMNMEETTLTLSTEFTYKYSPPHRFITGFELLVANTTTTQIRVTITIAGPSGNYTLLQQTVPTNANTWIRVSADSASEQMIQQVTPNNPLAQVAPIVLGRVGNYTLSLTLMLPKATGSTVVYVSSVSFYVYGSVYGVLGTDDQGRSVWSQFVYGARTSLEVGLLAALLTIALATLVGVSAGYYAGFVDETLMRINDILLSIPVLPLLLVLILVIDISSVKVDLNNLIILLIGLLGWQVYARAIRSQSLSLRERVYVQAARTLGVRPRVIIRRHIIPHLTGLIFALLAQAVPTAILLQAALAYLGFFDPNIFSWGRMLGEAQAYVVSPVSGFVWWWFLPPGIAIALVSMAFILIGNALNEEFNPKLQERT